MISDEDIQRVREATDLVAVVSERVQLKQRGRELWGCCPLHHEKTPSFKVDPASQFWHCFGCDEGGDAFGFIMKLDDLSFPDAVRKLAERANIELSETANTASKGRNARLKEACKAAEEHFHRNLMRLKSSKTDAARSYLASRDLGGNVPKEWNLGFAVGGTDLVNYLRKLGFTDDEMISANLAVRGRDGNVKDRFFDRVMFPIHDISGSPIAFGGRVIGNGEPKYLNTQETPIFHKSNVLFGLDKAKKKMGSSGCAIVTEGYTDVIAMHSAGFDNAVATLGTALTPNHIKQLSRQAGRRITYLFDGDEAGQRATERALQFIDESITPESGNMKTDLYALSLPEGKDPAEFLAAYGSAKMQALLDDAKPLILYGIERKIRHHDLSSPEGRSRALLDALSVLLPIRESILAKDYASQIADMLGYDINDVMRQLSNFKAPRSYQSVPDERKNAESPVFKKNSKLDPMLMKRLQVERELLSQCCLSPIDAISNAEALSSIKWHDSLHEKIADTMLATLLENVGITSQVLLQRCYDTDPRSAKVLTASILSADTESKKAIAFLLDEIAIADIEEEIALLKATLSGVSLSRETAEDASFAVSNESTFEKMVELQEKLSELKASRRTLDS